MAYGKYGWPLAFLVCVFGLMGQELYWSFSKCQLWAWDYRWLARSGFFVLLPLTFAVSADRWAQAGKEFWGLSFGANQRIPPKTCFGKWECALPSFIVGASFLWFILAISWFICAHLVALAFAGAGGITLGAGIWFAHYLKKGGKENGDEEQGQSGAGTSAKPEKSKQKPLEVVPIKPAPKGYDPEDNVLAMISGPSLASKAQMSSAHRLPPTPKPVAAVRPLVKGLSLGAFDCPRSATEGYTQTIRSLP